MKEEKEQKKKIKTWLKENQTVILLGTLEVATIIFGVIKMKTLEEQEKELERKNESLERENQDLRGQIHANERENRRLSRENGNLNYQLGKMAAGKKQ